MKAYEALVGKFFFVLPDTGWVGRRDGRERPLRAGAYRVLEFVGRNYTLERDGERFEVPAADVFVHATLFECMPELCIDPATS